MAELNGTLEEIRERIRKEEPKEIRDKLQIVMRFLDKLEQYVRFVRNVVYTISDDSQKLIFEIDIEQLVRDVADTG